MTGGRKVVIAVEKGGHDLKLKQEKDGMFRITAFIREMPNQAIAEGVYNDILRILRERGLL